MPNSSCQLSHKNKRCNSEKCREITPQIIEQVGGYLWRNSTDEAVGK